MQNKRNFAFLHPPIHVLHHKGCSLALPQWVWKINIQQSRAKPWLADNYAEGISSSPGSLFYQMFLLNLPGFFWGEINSLEHVSWAAELLILDRAGCSFPLLPVLFCAFDNEEKFFAFLKQQQGCFHSSSHENTRAKRHSAIKAWFGMQRCAQNSLFCLRYLSVH